MTSGLSFSDCEVPAENALPGVVGLRVPLSCLTQARYGIGWGVIGAATACYDTALQYAKSRKQFAIVEDYSVMRHMNNLESVYTYEGAHDIQRLIIGERITGVSACV